MRLSFTQTRQGNEHEGAKEKKRIEKYLQLRVAEEYNSLFRAGFLTWVGVGYL